MTPQQHQELIKSQIAASYNSLEKSHSTEDNNLEKGGAKVPIGTTHNGYKKVAEGKWQKVSSHGMTKKEHQDKKDFHNNTHTNLQNTQSEDKNSRDDEMSEHWNKKHEHKVEANKLNDKEYSDDEVLGKTQNTPKARDKLIANNGDRDFKAKVDFIEDGKIYFEVGDDQYSAELKDATQDDKGRWRLADYN
jgi:hypothetical protein